MTEEEVQAFLDSHPGWVVLSSLDPDGLPHSVPLGYFRDGADVVMGVRDDTRKVHNIERDPRVCLLLESGTSMADIRGIMLQGRAKLHRSPDEALACARTAARARGASESELPTAPRPGAVYIRVTPERVRSWDYGDS